MGVAVTLVVRPGLGTQVPARVTPVLVVETADEDAPRPTAKVTSRRLVDKGVNVAGALAAPLLGTLVVDRGAVAKVVAVTGQAPCRPVPQATTVGLAAMAAPSTLVVAAGPAPCHCLVSPLKIPFVLAVVLGTVTLAFLGPILFPAPTGARVSPLGLARLANEAVTKAVEVVGPPTRPAAPPHARKSLPVARDVVAPEAEVLDPRRPNKVAVARAETRVVGVDDTRPCRHPATTRVPIEPYRLGPFVRHSKGRTFPPTAYTPH